MKSEKIAFSILLVSMLAVPAIASDWVADFLKRYDPRGSVATVATTSTETLGQLIRTGEVPVTMSDVINLMIDNNLDIRSNRFAPRSSYLQSLVFYRALQPSLRFSVNRTHNTTLSNSQLNGSQCSLNSGEVFVTPKGQQFCIPANIQFRTNYAVSFSQALASGTSLTVDATLNRGESPTSNLNLFNPSYVGQLTYSVGQHLLQNRGRLPNTRQIIIAQNNEKISEIGFEIQLTSLLAQAQKSYWDLVFAGQDLSVKQRSLDLALKTLD